jgi:hypothetical protein
VLKMLHIKALLSSKNPNHGKKLPPNCIATKPPYQVLAHPVK